MLLQHLPSNKVISSIFTPRSQRNPAECSPSTNNVKHAQCKYTYQEPIQIKRVTYKQELF